MEWLALGLGIGLGVFGYFLRDALAELAQAWVAVSDAKIEYARTAAEARRAEMEGGEAESAPSAFSVWVRESGLEGVEADDYHGMYAIATGDRQASADRKIECIRRLQAAGAPLPGFERR